MSTTTMFEDQTVELLPARTTMKKWGGGGGKKGGGGNKVTVIQFNIAFSGNNSPITQTNAIGA